MKRYINKMVILIIITASVWTNVSCDNTSCGNNEQDIVVFAAAGTTLPLTSLAERLKHTENIKIHYSFASSSTLARQLIHGAEADCYISANIFWVKELIKQQIINPSQVYPLAANALVLISGPEQTWQWAADQATSLSEVFEGRLGLGDPDHVPAGMYAKESLKTLRQWESLEKRILPYVSVRATLRGVINGECPAGIVYASDLYGQSQVQKICELPADSHKPIIFYLVCLNEDKTAVQRLREILRSPEGSRLFESFGFKALKPIAR